MFLHWKAFLKLYKHILLIWRRFLEYEEKIVNDAFNVLCNIIYLSQYLDEFMVKRSEEETIKAYNSQI